MKHNLKPEKPGAAARPGSQARVKGHGRASQRLGFSPVALQRSARLGGAARRWNVGTRGGAEGWACRAGGGGGGRVCVLTDLCGSCGAWTERTSG